MESRSLRWLTLTVLSFWSCSRDLGLPPKPSDESFVSGRIVEATPGTDQVHAMAGASVAVLGSNLHAVSDQQGGFTLGPLPEGAWPLFFTARGSDDTVRQRLVGGVQLKRGATRSLGDVLMQENAQLGGRVLVDNHQAGNAGVLVFVPGTDFATTTADTGGYALRNLPSGTVRVSAFRPGFKPATTSDIDLQGGVVTSAADLRISAQPSPSPGAILGTVVVMEAPDSSGVRVQARSFTTGLVAAETTTAAKGSFALPALAADLYALEFTREAYPPARIPNLVVASGMELTLAAPVVMAPYGVSNVAADAGIGPGLVVEDAGVEAPDAGPPDAGPLDAGTDAGSTAAPDAGPLDAGTCLTEAQCPTGLLCLNRECVNCSATLACRPGFTCHTGACLKDCQSNTECPPGLVCSAGACGPCLTSAQCADPALICSAQGACAQCQNRGQCPGGKACLATGCGDCTRDLDCGPGALCEQGACVTGDCRANADCAPAQACVGRSCAACTADSQCRVGQLCLNGACAQANCRGVTDCGAGQVCLANLCGGCAQDSDCGTGKLCLSTAGGPRCSPGTCRLGADCVGASAGLVCDGNNQCVPCTGSGQCAGGQVCTAQGRCVTGNCSSAQDCSGAQAGYVCASHACSPCLASTDCGAGQVCDTGRCVAGNCLTAQDCGVQGQLCLSHACGNCTSSAQCGAGQVCGADRLCHAGTCATSLDCAAATPGKVCNASYQCVGCAADAQCAPWPGTLCVTQGGGLPSAASPGTCSAATCRLATDCAAGQACINLQCAACRADADCGAGQLCLPGAGGNTCTPGTCRTNANCTGGLVCDATHTCSACASTAQCADATKVCEPATGTCVTGNCVTAADCGAGQICLGHACQACTLDAECAPGQLCIAGACKVAACKDSAGCSGGAQVCELTNTNIKAAQYTCRACAPLNGLNATECGGTNHVCDATGTCRAGQCTQSSTCTGGKVCLNFTCTPCSTDAQCSAGSLCINSACAAGTCHGNGADPNADCPSNHVCVSNLCTGNCRANTDCAGTVANPGTSYCEPLSHTCSACTSTAQCGVGSGRVCVGGACIVGTCTATGASPNDVPCLQSQACIAQSCVQVAPAAQSAFVDTEPAAVVVQPTQTFAAGKSRLYFSVNEGGNNVALSLDATMNRLWSVQDNTEGNSHPTVGPFLSGMVVPAPGFPLGELFLTPQGKNGGQTNIMAHRADTGALTWTNGTNGPAYLALSLAGGIPQVARAAGSSGSGLVLMWTDGTHVRTVPVLGCSAILALAGGTDSVYVVCAEGVFGVDPVSDTVAWSYPFSSSIWTTTTASIWRPATATGDLLIITTSNGSLPVTALFIPDSAGGPVTPTVKWATTTFDKPIAPPVIDEQGALYLMQYPTKLGKLSVVDGTVLANVTLNNLTNTILWIYSFNVAGNGTVVVAASNLLSGFSVVNGTPGSANLLWQLGASPTYPSMIPTLSPLPVVFADGGVADGGLVATVRANGMGTFTDLVGLVTPGPTLPAPTWPAWGPAGDAALTNCAPAYRCAQDNDCSSTQFCVMHRCIGTCRAASSCPAGQGCQLAQCGPCMTDSACRAQEVCNAGACWACDRTTDATCCSTTAECGLSSVCLQGHCKPTPDPLGAGSWLKVSSTSPTAANQQVLGTDGTLYFLDSGTTPTLRAYSPNGTLAWQSPAAPLTPPAGVWPLLFNVSGQDVIVVPWPQTTTLLVATVSGASFGTWKTVSFSAMGTTSGGLALAQGISSATGTAAPALFMAQTGRLWAVDTQALASGTLQVLWQLNTVGCADSTSASGRLVVGSDATLYYACNDGTVQAFNPDGTGPQPAGVGRSGQMVWSASPAAAWANVRNQVGLGKVPGQADVLYVSHGTNKQMAVLRVARAGLVSRTEVAASASVGIVVDNAGTAWVLGSSLVSSVSPTGSLLGEWSLWTPTGGNGLLTTDGSLWFVDGKAAPASIAALSTTGTAPATTFRIYGPTNAPFDAAAQLSWVPSTLTGNGKALLTADDALTSQGYPNRMVMGMPTTFGGTLTQWGTALGDLQHRASLKTQ